MIVINPDMRRYLGLMEKSWDELGFGYEMNPNFELYDTFIADGLYTFYGAEIDGEPVGYIGVMGTRSLFNPARGQVVMDSFYVLPEYRKGIVPSKLFSAVAMDSRGKELMFGCQRDSALAKALLKRGFKEGEVIYVKEV